MLPGDIYTRHGARKEQYEKQNKKALFLYSCICFKYLYDASDDGWRNPCSRGSRQPGA